MTTRPRDRKAPGHCTSLKIQVGLVNGPDPAFVEFAEEPRKILLLDVEVDAVDEGHGGLGVLQDERGRENPCDLLLQPGRPVAVAETDTIEPLGV